MFNIEKSNMNKKCDQPNQSQTYAKNRCLLYGGLFDEYSYSCGSLIYGNHSLCPKH